MDKRTILLLLCTAILTLLLLQPNKVSASTTPAAAVVDAEIEREKQITKELSLNMPDQTEDPNYPVTFIDPGKQGVDVTVDDKTITKAPNPFLLPNLTIGEHKIIFKFRTKDGVVRVLTKKILVTPKPPQFDPTLKTEVVKPATVVVKGLALPQSTIMLIINSDKTHKITSTTDGKWEFIIPEPQEGNNNIIAFTIKNGIVSNASKTFAVTYHQNAIGAVISPSGDENANKVLEFSKTILKNIDTNRKERPTVFYGAIGVATLAILVMIDLRLRKRAAKRRDEKTIATLFGDLQEGNSTIVEVITQTKLQNKKSKTVIRDKKVEEKPNKKSTDPLQKAKKVTKKSEPLEVIEDTSGETEEPEKKVLSKEEFLKQFRKDGEQDE
ncbi:hypothetical protein IT418_02640 [bacterium]|nr:hypothetical protein [bacterium]